MTKSPKLIVCLLLASALVLGGCEQDGTQPKNEGGVDGSGGILSYIVESSFKNWVENDHRYFVRDVLNRLILLKEKSPKDLEVTGPLGDRFIGEHPEELMTLLNKVQFYSVAGSCPSNNHPDSDASWSQDGRICFSYAAFKKFPPLELMPKLLAMTMHELAHARGFNEDDAVKWQLLFADGSFRDKTILVQNDFYEQARKSVGEINIAVSKALQHIVRRDSRVQVCQEIAVANSRGFDFLYVGQDLPSYLKETIHKKILTVISGFAGHCGRLEDAILAKGLAEILETSRMLSREFAFYETPICQNELCATRFYPATNSGNQTDPEHALIEWNIKKETFAASTPYTDTQFSDVNCSLTNLTDQKEVLLTRKTEGLFELDSTEFGLPGLNFLQLRKPENASHVEIRWTHMGFGSISESVGFATSAYAFTGFLQKRLADRATLRFAMAKSESKSIPRSIDGRVVEELPYTMFEPRFMALKNAPEISKEFALSCWLEQ